MNKYLGLFIDDDQKNFESIKRLFSLKNIQLLPYENLPQDINEIYQKVIDQNVDFVIIDYDLGKQAVKYTGIDVLKNIREQDAEIYIIYLTNKDFVEDHTSHEPRETSRCSSSAVPSTVLNFSETLIICSSHA